MLHINLDENHYEGDLKIAIWEQFIDRCSSNLKDNDKNVVNSVIQCLVRFFEIYDNKMLNKALYQAPILPIHAYCSDESGNTSGSFLITTDTNVNSDETQGHQKVHDYHSDDKRSNFKTIYIGYKSSILDLRSIISESLEISSKEFALIVDNKELGPEEDDYTVRQISDASVKIESRSQVSELNNIHPSNLLAGKQEFFNLIFDLLSNDEDYDVENLWKLLMKLPQDEVPAAKKLEKLDINSNEDWDELIDGSSLHKLLYALQIINKFQYPESQWKKKFLALNGYHHLFNTMLKIDPSKIQSTLSFKSVSNLCTLISDTFQDYQVMNKEDQQMKECYEGLLTYLKQHSLEAIDQILKLIHQIVRLSITELKKRGESYDDLYYKNRRSEQKNNRMLSYYDNKSKDETSKNEQEEQNQYLKQVTELNAKF